jgi:hypothetical protein
MKILTPYLAQFQIHRESLHIQSVRNVGRLELYLATEDDGAKPALLLSSPLDSRRLNGIHNTWSI